MAEDIDNTQQTTAPSGPTDATSGSQCQSVRSVGGGHYEVEQGECIKSIAYDHGLFWETLWNRSENAQLKQKREDPSVLFPGDVVFIPDRKEKSESGQTDRRHRFRRRGVPASTGLQLICNGEPLPNKDYWLEIDGELSTGITDGEGRLVHTIPPNARRGRVTVRMGKDEAEFDIVLGEVDPRTEISGVQQRLRNLGWDNVPLDGELGPDTLDAIREFQEDRGLEITGELDPPTLERLRKEHGA
jgi:hypothetical protein